MSLNARRELVATISPRYRIAGKSEKAVILNELVASTGYDRKYAIVLLREAGSARKRSSKRTRRACRYGPSVRHALVELWKLSDGQCGKLLVAAIPALIDRLKAFGELTFCPDVERKLLTISAATIDRVLAQARQQGAVGISTTRTGSLLKQQIAIRMFDGWDDTRPGFAEIDLVAHCGQNSGGDFAYTLTLTDVATGWVELCAIKNRSQIAVTDALERIRKRMPFALLGIDCDNGSEFINYQLQRYCQEHKVQLTRCRPYKKNDQCYVEQKNGAVVRRLVGYERYEGEEAVIFLNRIYALDRLYRNYFAPCRKLTGKIREGAKTKKTYDQPQSPYQRLLQSECLSDYQADELRSCYDQINPATVRRTLDSHWHTLATYAVRSPSLPAHNSRPKAPQADTLGQEAIHITRPRLHPRPIRGG